MLKEIFIREFRVGSGTLEENVEPELDALEMAY